MNNIIIIGLLWLLHCVYCMKCAMCNVTLKTETIAIRVQFFIVRKTRFVSFIRKSSASFSTQNIYVCFDFGPVVSLNLYTSISSSLLNFKCLWKLHEHSAIKLTTFTSFYSPCMHFIHVQLSIIIIKLCVVNRFTTG